MILRKICLFFVALLILPLASAITKPPPLKMMGSYFDGIYTGIGIGGSYNTASVKSTWTDSESINDGPVTTPRTYTLDKNLNNFSVASTFLFGYGGVFSKTFYVGGELYLNVIPVDYSVSDTQTINGIDGTTKAKMESYVSSGIGVKGGYLITPRIMLYLMLAADLSGMDLDIDHNNSTSSFSNDCSARLFNLVPSIGVEFMATDKISIRAQYSLYYYGSYSDSGNQSNVVNSYDIWPSTTSTYYSKNNDDISGVSMNVGLISVIYHFNGL